MRRREKILMVTSIVAVLACGGPTGDRTTSGQEAAGGEPTPTETQEDRAEARRAAARSEKQVAARELEARFEQIRERAAALGARAEAFGGRLDDALHASIDRVEAVTDEGRDAVARFADAGIDGWEQASGTVSERLDDLEATVDEVSRALADQAEVLERRDPSRRPVTGLFEAMDGGEYEAYRVSVVLEVQAALREQGYYPGPVDGFLGRPTMDAVARFQEDHGVRPTGVPSPETRKRLLRS